MGQAKQRRAEITVIKNASQFPVEIRAVKHITPEFWSEMQDRFTQSYRPCAADPGAGVRRIPYDPVAQYSLAAVAYRGPVMVGFVMILDLLGSQHWAQANGMTMSNADSPIWRLDRDPGLNTRQIEICWVHPQHRSQGIATRLYRYAIQHMGVTQIHIEPDRVWDNIPYWRELGFANTILYSFGGPDTPSLRLHLPTAHDYFYPLSKPGIVACFRERDLPLHLAPHQDSRFLPA